MPWTRKENLKLGRWWDHGDQKDEDKKRMGKSEHFYSGKEMKPNVFTCKCFLLLLYGPVNSSFCIWTVGMYLKCWWQCLPSLWWTNRSTQEKNNPSEKVGNYREDRGKEFVTTIFCGRNGTGTPLMPSGQEGWNGVTTPAMNQGRITGVLSGSINPEAPVLT